MTIVAFVRSECIAFLRRAAPPGEQVVLVNDLAAAVAAVRRPPDLLILEPALLRPGQSELLIRDAELGGIATMIYFGRELESIGEGLSVVSATRADILVLPAAENPLMLRARLSRVPDVPASTEVVRHLAPRLRLLPGALAQAVVTMFAIPGPNDSPKELAACGGMARRSVDRWIGRAGIPSARLLVAAARLTGLHDSIASTGGTVSTVLRSGKLGSLVAVRRQCHTLTGWSLSELRREPKAALVRKIEQALRPPALCVPATQARFPSHSQVDALPMTSIGARNDSQVAFERV
jgi:hypothetical protein